MHHIECSGMNGAVRRLLWLSSAGYVPRKQFVDLVDLVDLVIGDATERVGQPSLRINAVQLGRFVRHIGDGGRPTAV